jgi:hypothetical protein
MIMTATFNPKGGAQTRWCVPKYQNSATQGPMLAKFISKCGIKANDKILVKIKGGCRSYNFPKKRDGTNTPVLKARANIELESSNSTLRNPYGDGSLQYVAVSVDELADGHYDFTVNFDGQIDNATILNKYGEIYANVESPNDEAVLSFDINDGSNLPAAIIAWTSKAVNVTYSGTGRLSNETSSSASSSGAVSTGSTSLATSNIELKRVVLATTMATLLSSLLMLV